MTRPAAAERAPGRGSPSAPRSCASDDVDPARPASRSASCSPTHRIGRRPASSARRELAADQLVGLAGVAAPLGVADDDPRREPGQHRRRDLAGVGARQLVMDVLGADRRRPDRLGERVADRREAHERRADHPGHARPRGSAPRSSRASSPASAGVVCIFQLAATMTSRMRANHARAAAVDGRRPAALGRRAVGQALDPLEGPLDRRAMELEALGELGEARLGRLAPGVGHEPDDVRLLAQPAVGVERPRSRRAAGRRR